MKTGLTFLAARAAARLMPSSPILVQDAEDSRYGREIARTICATSLVITAAAVLSAAAFEIFAADVIRPALAADASNGKRVAQLWCAACHVVTVSQRQANADAPPFEEIAKRAKFSEPGLVTFLLDPHAKMPNMNLTRIEANDIAAYIGTLR